MRFTNQVLPSLLMAYLASASGSPQPPPDGNPKCETSDKSPTGVRVLEMAEAIKDRGSCENCVKNGCSML